MRRPDEMTLLWMVAGPRAGEVLPCTVAEAEEAEKAGFGQSLTDRSSLFPFSTPKVGKHKAAEKWLAARIG